MIIFFKFPICRRGAAQDPDQPGAELHHQDPGRDRDSRPTTMLRPQRNGQKESELRVLGQQSHAPDDRCFRYNGH